MAVHGDGSAHQGNQVFGNGHSQAGSAVFLPGHSAFLLKRKEQPVHKLTAHTHAVVTHRKAQPHLSVFFPKLSDFQADFSALRRELKRIGQQVQQDLVQPQGISLQDCFGKIHQGHGEFQPFGRRLGIDDGGEGLRYIFQVKYLMGNGHFSFIYFGHIQHIVNQRHQMLGGITDFFQTVLHAAAVFNIGACNGGHADDRIHGRTDFVAHAGKEILLGRIGILRIEQGILQRLLDFHAFRLIRQGNNIAHYLALYAFRIQLQPHPFDFPGDKADSQIHSPGSPGTCLALEFFVGRLIFFQDQLLHIIRGQIKGLFFNAGNPTEVGTDIFQIILFLIINKENIVHIGGKYVKQTLPVPDLLYPPSFPQHQAQEKSRQHNGQQRQGCHSHTGGIRRYLFQSLHLFIRKRNNSNQAVIYSIIFRMQLLIHILEDFLFSHSGNIGRGFLLHIFQSLHGLL